MKRAVYFVGAALVFGCGGTVQQEEPIAGNGTAGAPGRIAAGVSSPRGAEPAPQPEAPPFLFTPQPHAYKHRDQNIPTPDIASLPQLQMRFAQCFPELERKRAPIATSPSGGSGRGRAVKSSSGAKKKGRSAGKPSAMPSSLSSTVGSGAPATRPPSPAPQKREEARAKPKRAKDDAAKSAPPPPPAAAPMEAYGSADMAYARSEEAESADREGSAEDYGEDEDRALEAEEPPEPEYPYWTSGKKRIAGERLETPPPPPEPDPDDRFDDWGQAVYLSNDDTMSLSSAERVIFAIDNFLPLPAEHIRPHELLNYFSFDVAPVDPGNDFSVYAELDPDPRETGIYGLGMAVNGRPVTKQSRRNAAVTLVIDRSGSMSDEGRMDYLKRGLLKMLDELKYGDMVHVVLFDHEVCVPAENFVVGRDKRSKLEKVINALEPRGATDLHRGLSTGYEIADRSYGPSYSNRVIMITDALANTGVVDPRLITMISKFYDNRRIRLSGVGVGREFNDELLDRLTERGKGAYVFLGSEAEVDAVFGSHFISLIETTALDVHFRLHLPPSLRMNVFYGEESSTVKSDVQEIHYFANTSQLFLSDLMARGGKLRPEDGVMLTIEYKDPESNQGMVEEYAFELGPLMNHTRNVKKGRFIMAWVDMLAAMAERPVPSYYRGGAGSWQDDDARQKCEAGQEELSRLSRDLGNDPEVIRVKELFVKYCARYERPRNPVKRDNTPPRPILARRPMITPWRRARRAARRPTSLVGDRGGGAFGEGGVVRSPLSRETWAWGASHRRRATGRGGHGSLRPRRRSP